ncbi:MAG TPA: sugar transferase [Methylomirabilota bacterium]|nr:sugar transferase [Methylomirabilota bacterium]
MSATLTEQKAGARGGGSRGANRQVLLQRKAPGTFRRHLARSFLRVAFLAAADLGVFLLLRQVVRALRDSAMLGSSVSNLVSAAIPRGYLGGWQFAAALLLGLAAAGAYGRGDQQANAGHVLAGVLLGVSLSLWHSIWTSGPAAVALQFAVTSLAVWAALATERSVVDRVLSRLLSRCRESRIPLVGDRRDREAVAAFKALTGGSRVVPIGWVYPGRARVDGEYLGTTERFWELLHRADADTVVLCGDLDPASYESVVEASCAAGCHVLALSRHHAVVRARPGLVWHRGVPFVEISVPALRALQLIVKRGIDLVVAGVGLVALAPVMAVIGLAIKLDSPGPALFWQERVGYAGRVFRMLKFRTMRDGADADKPAVAHLNQSGDPRLFKIPEDPRVTRLGSWLRRWSLDELPQLWNVLKGDMSLVGPRPFFESDLKEYSDHHFGRLGAKPGITGLWQVKGRSLVVDFEEVVRLDREYIDRWSLWLDLKVLFQTVPAVFRRTGAY